MNFDIMVRMVVMQIFHPQSDPAAPAYLKAYDPDCSRYNGRIEMTTNKAEAMQFADFSEGFECWRRQSSTVPFRPDGRPNRPLTAFSVTFVDPA